MVYCHLLQNSSGIMHGNIWTGGLHVPTFEACSPARQGRGRRSLDRVHRATCHSAHRGYRDDWDSWPVDQQQVDSAAGTAVLESARLGASITRARPSQIRNTTEIFTYLRTKSVRA